MAGPSVNIDMSEEAKATLGQIWKDAGMTQRAALLRIFTWFLKQEPMVRSLVLGHIPPEDSGDIIDLMYRRRHAGGIGTAEEAVADELEADEIDAATQSGGPKKRRTQRKIKRA